MKRIVESLGVGQGAVGQVVPWGIGTLRQAPGIPICVPPVDTLREAMTAGSPASGGRIKLTDQTVLGRFRSTGTWQIDGERGTYTGIDLADRALTGIERGTESTTPDAHPIGSAVAEVRDIHVYGFVENPRGGLLQRTRSLDAIYMGGTLKAASEPPTHTVNLRDQTALAGTELVTVTFDMSSVGALTSEFVVPSTLAALQRKLDSDRVWFDAFNPVNIDRIQGLQLSLQPLFGAQFTASFNGPGPAGLAAGVFLPGPSPKLLPLTQLPPVTADLTGLLDVTGELTGTAGQLIRTPAHVVWLALRDLYQQDEATFDAASFAATALEQQALGLAWDFTLPPLPFSEFVRLVALQSRADLFRDAGTWFYVFRKRVSVGYTFGTRSRLSAQFGETALQQVLAGVEVIYGEGPQQQTMRVPSARTIVDPSRIAGLAMPWIAASGPARVEAAYWLGLQDHPAPVAQLVDLWPSLSVRRGDTVAVTSPLLDGYGVDHAYRVQGARLRADGAIEYDLFETEATPTAAELAEAADNEALLLVQRQVRVGTLPLVADEPAAGAVLIGHGADLP